MSTTTPETMMSGGEVIRLIQSGTYPPEVVQTIARGFLPLPQGELIPVLAYLATSSDAETMELARASLEEVPPRAMIDFATDESLPGQHLTYLLRATRDNLVAEALIRNRSVPDEVVADLARTAPAVLQEVIVINQARILRAPGILDALLANPELSPDARRRALETKEEFFEKKARLLEEEEAEAAAAAAEAPPLPVDYPLEAISDLLEKAETEGTAELTVSLSESEKKDNKTFAAWAKLQFMSVSERVQIAFKGDRMMRMFLIKDRNKLICTAVMRNPRISEQEIENIAGMRNVDQEVLRLIAMNREWSSKYPIMLSLCRNPKAPIGVVLPFINRLTLRDLKGLKDDKGVSQVVRETAKRFYLARTQKTG